MYTQGLVTPMRKELRRQKGNQESVQKLAMAVANMEGSGRGHVTRSKGQCECDMRNL